MILQFFSQSAKQNSMLDLEMADYERTISTLNAQVAEKDSKVTQVNRELEKLEQRISLMQTQLGELVKSLYLQTHMMNWDGVRESRDTILCWSCVERTRDLLFKYCLTAGNY